MTITLDAHTGGRHLRHLDEMALNQANKTIADINAAMIDQIATLSRECQELRTEVAELRAQPNRRPLMTKQQAAEYLGCSISTINDLMGRGKLPVVRFDKRPRFRADDLDLWIESRIESHDA